MEQCSRKERTVTEVSLTTITEETDVTAEATAAYLNTLNSHKDYCRRVRLKERVASESVVILGSYFTLTFGTFIVLQYFMPPGFYQVKSELKYNTLLLVQLLLILNSSLNPLVHYWRNPKVRRRVNSLLGAFFRLLFSRVLNRYDKNNKSLNKKAECHSNANKGPNVNKVINARAAR